MDDGYGNTFGVMTRRIVFLVTLIVVIFCAYLIVSAIITAETTGILKVSSTQKATISVSRANGQAENIGKPGSAGVRLKPGTYQVVATTSNSQVSAQTVSIQKKKLVKVNLSPTTSPKLPSVSSVSFFGMSALTDHGVSSDQVNTLRLNFFQFKTSAGSISINTGSVKTPPHVLGDPFIITFNVNVDSQTYKAKTTYNDWQSIKLQLYNPSSGKLIYDSYASSESPDYPN